MFNANIDNILIWWKFIMQYDWIFIPCLVYIKEKK